VTGKLLTSHGATCQQCRQDVTKLIMCEAKKGIGWRSWHIPQLLHISCTPHFGRPPDLGQSVS